MVLIIIVVVIAILHSSSSSSLPSIRPFSSLPPFLRCLTTETNNCYTIFEDFHQKNHKISPQQREGRRKKRIGEGSVRERGFLGKRN